MTSISKVITARSLLDSFSKVEMNQLLLDFVKANGPNALLIPFFNQFLNSNKANANIQHIDSLTDIINTIITSRKINNDDSSPNTVLGTFPKAIIGEVASYLHQKDNISLSMTKRAIYVDCNHPKTLKHLDLKKIDNYSCKIPPTIVARAQKDIASFTQIDIGWTNGA